MDRTLTDVIERAKDWDADDQALLISAAADIEDRIKTRRELTKLRTLSLFDVMQACPVTDFEFERRSSLPTWRDIEL